MTGGSNHRENASNKGVGRIARGEYDKFSPIRQIGAQIGTDYNTGAIIGAPTAHLKISNAAPLASAGGVSANFNLFDERLGMPFNANNELEMDSADNMSNSNVNHSTLSPQRLHSIREEAVGNR